jgi:hypothetical protein
MVWVMVVPAVDAIVVGRFCPTGAGWLTAERVLAALVGLNHDSAWPWMTARRWWGGGMAGDMGSSAREGFGNHGLPGHRVDDAVDP